MPFGSQKPESPKKQFDAPLHKITGLWPFKSGTGLGGTFRPNYISKDGNESAGDQLITLITQAMEENKEVRFMVFDNQARPGTKVPYQLVCSVSEPYQRQESAPQSRDTDDTTPDTPAPIVLPPPSRRTAPRR